MLWLVENLFAKKILYRIIDYVIFKLQSTEWKPPLNIRLVDHNIFPPGRHLLKHLLIINQLNLLNRLKCQILYLIQGRFMALRNTKRIHTSFLKISYLLDAMSSKICSKLTYYHGLKGYQQNRGQIWTSGGTFDPCLWLLTTLNSHYELYNS